MHGTNQKELLTFIVCTPLSGLAITGLRYFLRLHSEQLLGTVYQKGLAGILVHLLGFFAGIIVFIFALYKLKFLKPIPSFWFAYIMTRPLGASIGDLLGNQPNFSYGYTSVVFIGVIVVFTAYLTATGVDQIYPELCGVSAEVKKNEEDVENAKEIDGEVKVAELERRHSDEVQPL